MLLASVLLLLPLLITLNLKHEGENVVAAQDNLQSYVSETQLQDGLLWRVIGGRIPPEAARQQVVASRERAAAHLAKSVSLGLSAEAGADIATLSQSYDHAVDAEQRLLAQGLTQQALSLHLVGQLTATLNSLAVDLSAQAGKAQRWGDLGVLATVLLSLMAVTVVQGRRRRIEVRQQTRQQSEARYRTLIDRSSDLVLVLDPDGKLSFASPSAERLLVGEDEANGRAREGSAADTSLADATLADLLAVVDPADRARLSVALQTATAENRAIGEFRLNSTQHSSTFELALQDLSGDPSVNGVVLTGHDVTDRLALHQEMEHRALHDELTGLPNRALLFDRCEQALLGAERTGTTVGVLLLDLERFKEVNDTFGHHYGDELLRQIGPRLAGRLREVDTVSRLGGDEFAILLQDVKSVDVAVEVAATLLAALEAPFHVEGVDLDVEGSIGVVVSGEHGQNVISLIQHADIAMYVAKTQHLGVFAYDPSIDEHSASKLALVGDLRRGLECDELVLYYQPQVSASTGALVGAEALARWQHPLKGLVMPDDFIPVAERTGLINPLTRRVLDIALAQARTWIDQGRPLPIAVNLSVRNLHDENFVDLIAQLLDDYDVPARLLELEVTESAIMIDPERARQTMEKLSALGIRLSLDDFGAGYTSLSQLKDLPITDLKIDKSFVMSMAHDAKDSLIVQSLISLGHNLGLTMVAEGVESAELLAALAGLGCDVAQGHHISEPIPAADFDTWSMTGR